ncbi:hypothetical protein DUI87_07892 [Hirundo rustica rustica]|uniref:Uncharacterized protein n=1 Tax=Hirundo rustica rustica TaxID=333673 RepID=A0A3M0KR01_HIRRU|nr:hypothetical protein DUI87_07892 [Hirundo rustica rustica]
MPKQVDAQREGGCDHMGSQHWKRLLAGPVDPWRKEPTLEQGCSLDLWTHGGPINLFLMACTLWEGPALEELMEDSPMGGAPHHSRGRV